MSSLFRRKLDELEDMFIASQDDLLARFSSTFEENKRLKEEIERLKSAPSDIERVQAQADFYKSKLMDETAYKTNTNLLDQVKHLEAKIERLHKIGDALVLISNPFRHKDFDSAYVHKTHHEWQEAVREPLKPTLPNPDPFKGKMLGEPYNGNIKGLDF